MGGDTSGPAEPLRKSFPLPRGAAAAASLLLAITSVVIAACDSSGPSEPAGTLTAVRIQPENPQIEVGATLQLDASGVDASGNAIEPPSIFWSTEDPSIATVAAESGVVTARAVGSTRIAASSQGVATVTTITVVPVPVASVDVSPDETELEVGGTATLSAVVRDRNGDGATGVTVNWTSDNTSIATVDDAGRVTARSPGSTTIKATAEGKSGSAKVAVRPAEVQRVEISPTSAQLSVLGTQQFTAKAYSKYDLEITGRQVQWRTSNAAVVTISASGLARGILPGSANVWAEIDGKRSENVPVAVSARPVAAVTIAPTSASMSVGETRQFQATARASNGDQLDGRQIDWSTTDGSVAAVSQNGMVTALAPGTAKVRAISEGRHVEATITVVPAAVDRVVISPASAQLTVGETLQFQAIPRDSRDQALTGRTASWSSSNPSVLTVSNEGVALGVGEGSAKVRVEIEGKQAEASVNVVARPVASVTISPTSAEIEVGTTRQFSVVARDDQGRELTGRPATWSTSNKDIATVTKDGLARGVAPGTVKIRVDVQGRQAEAELRVSAPAVASVEVTPSSAELNIGKKRKFSATVYDSRGDRIDGKQVVWSSSNDDIVSVSPNGDATAKAEGVAEIRAAADGRTGSATVTVQPMPVDKVEISPASIELGLLQTQELTVILKGAGGTVLTGRTVTWSSDKPAIATVTSAGGASAVVRGLLPGEATITATSEGRTGTAKVTVRLFAGSGAKLDIVSGNDQVGPNDRALADPLVVRLLDGDGRPIAGVEVKWSTNNGNVSPRTSTTDENGYSQTTWTLGGGNRNRDRFAWAEVEGLPAVQFRARRR